MQTDEITASFGPKGRRVKVGRIAEIAPEGGFTLDSGMKIAKLPVAFQTYGKLNAARDNAVLICHGLTGDQYLASPHPVTGKPGWWEHLVGEGKAVDTSRYFVICSNVIGGCMGSFGPKTIDPATGMAYALTFPVITISDMVRAQAALIDQLGIKQLMAVVGGSMGGMQALEWAASYPDSLRACMPIATAARHSAQNIAFHEIGRQAVMADPDWCGGDYQAAGRYPAKGLAVARMTAHVTYVSEMALAQKFGRKLQDREAIGFGFEADFQVESYLRYQGAAFVERFDPNSYLYITRAMDYFDLARDHGGKLAAVFAASPVRFCLVSFSSDWCFASDESRFIVRALNAAGAMVSFTEITTDKGHDAFLLDVPELASVVTGFLAGVANG